MRRARSIVDRAPTRSSSPKSPNGNSLCVETPLRQRRPAKRPTAGRSQLTHRTRNRTRTRTADCSPTTPLSKQATSPTLPCLCYVRLDVPFREALSLVVYPPFLPPLQPRTPDPRLGRRQSQRQTYSRSSVSGRAKERAKPPEGGGCVPIRWISPACNSAVGEN